MVLRQKTRMEKMAQPTTNFATTAVFHPSMLQEEQARSENYFEKQIQKNLLFLRELVDQKADYIGGGIYLENAMKALKMLPSKSKINWRRVVLEHKGAFCEKMLRVFFCIHKRCKQKHPNALEHLKVVIKTFPPPYTTVTLSWEHTILPNLQWAMKSKNPKNAKLRDRALACMAIIHVATQNYAEAFLVFQKMLGGTDCETAKKGIVFITSKSKPAAAKL